MIELLYPLDFAPLIPQKAESASSDGYCTEYFPVMEPSGIVIGRSSREYCHSGVKILHPVVHLHIFNRNAELYLQKRSEKKDIQPGKWDTAVGGHVSYGESFMEALFREASEELGLSEFNPVHLVSYEFESEVEKEFVASFAAIGNFAPAPDKDEVDDGRFWSIEEIENNIGKDIFTPNFESEFEKVRPILLSLL